MNKLNKIAFSALLVMSMFGIVGCGGESVEDVAEKCVDCLKDADFDTMRQMSTGGMIQWIDNAERKYDEVSRLLGENLAEEFKDTYDDLEYEMGEPTANGDKWTVSVKINGQGTMMTLIKLSGHWRVEKFEFPII